MKLKMLFLLLFSTTLIGCDLLKEDVYYQNPIGEMIDIGDPYVLKYNDTYYMYATSLPGSGFLVWQSDNLVDWDSGTVAYAHSQQDERWATGDFWAPEVIYHEDLFYMVYSARDQSGSLKMAIATSESPTGPFIDQTVDLINLPGSYIDGHFFIDDDGTPYMYYVKDNYENIVDGNNVSHIYVQKMTDDLLEVTGEPELLLVPDQAWENPNANYQWNEGPYVVKNEGLYYLMYSANVYSSPDYAIGYAVSDQPTGPFEKYENNPILSKDLENDISGPGHNSVTVGLDNSTLYAVYHIHTDPHNPSGNRRPAIDRLYFENGELKIDGPTSDEQKLH
ncbi:glycoside hydrolase family 43 protein [Alkalibacterium iburiense]|uniref:Glycoside hydrolase family 43 protein n=1 Tax=Alkalibacterium iburiense TaxID=290589 RepID=A0ABN0XIY3_9LACT